LLTGNSVIYAKQKVTGTQKIAVQFPPTIKSPNFKLKFAHFVPKAVRSSPNLCAKKVSHPVGANKHQDPRFSSKLD